MTGAPADVLVVGGGPGGYPAAIRAAQRGARTVLVEAGDLGGVCLNEGCIPSKGLLEAADVLFRARRLVSADLDGREAFRSARQRNDRAVGQLRSGIQGLLRAAGVEVVAGQARFTGPDRLLVDRADGATEERTFRHAIVATGSAATAIPGIEGPDVVDARGVLELVQLPAAVAVIGAGAIGLELASALRRFGSSVTVVEVAPQVLPGLDAGLADHVRRALVGEGIELLLGASVKSRGDGGLRVETADGTERPVAADLIVVAAGRRPRTGGLGLDAAGVVLDDRGAIAVDSVGATSNPNIAAIGDVTPGPGLAHRATAEGLRVADRLTGAAPAATPLVIPSVVYTDPTVVSVGLDEGAAIAAGLDPTAVRVPLGASGRSVVTEAGSGEVVLVVGPSGIVVGVHAVGHGVEGLAQVAATMIEMGALVDDVAAVVAPHPTVGELLTEAAHLLEGFPVHVPRPRPAIARKVS